MARDILLDAYAMGPHEFQPDLSGKPFSEGRCRKCGTVYETSVHHGERGG